MVNKEDWEKLLKATQDDKDKLNKAYEMTIPQFDLMIDLYKKKIAEYPEEKDDMPKELKEDWKRLVG